MCKHLLDTPKTPERERRELQAGAQDNRKLWKLCEETCLEIRAGTLETWVAAASREFTSDTPKPVSLNSKLQELEIPNKKPKDHKNYI